MSLSFLRFYKPFGVWVKLNYTLIWAKYEIQQFQPVVGTGVQRGEKWQLTLPFLAYRKSDFIGRSRDSGMQFSF